MYDVIVIGGGPGGYAAAIRASQLKGKVAIVEAKAMGGTCVLRGCIPSKVWMHAGALLETARKAGDFGLKLTVGELDFDAVFDEEVMGLFGVNGRGRLVAPGKVDVDGNVLEAKSVIVATGSQLKKCDVPGADAIVMTTDQLLEMDAAPASVLITDPSYIGVEMAMLLSVFGSKVTMALPGPRILPDEDQDTSQRLAQSLRERGVKIMARYALVKVDGKKCTLKGSSKEAEVEVERVIVSARMPVANNLGLEALGQGILIEDLGVFCGLRKTDIALLTHYGVIEENEVFQLKAAAGKLDLALVGVDHAAQREICAEAREQVGREKRLCRQRRGRKRQH